MEKSKQRGWPVRAAVRDPALAATLDEVAHGVLVTTPDARLIHANRAGRHELARGGTIAVDGRGFVRACQVGCDADLQAALGRTAFGKRALVGLGSPAALLSAVVVPLRMVEGGSSRCAIVLSRRAACDPLMLGFFARRHRLTPAEEQVLAVLCDGVSAPQAAQRMNLAVSTIRSHVRSICVKTRSRSVRELLQRLALLPPLSPAVVLHSVGRAHPSC